MGLFFFFIVLLNTSMWAYDLLLLKNKVNHSKQCYGLFTMPVPGCSSMQEIPSAIQPFLIEVQSWCF